MLDPTSSIVWTLLDRWREVAELEGMLTEAFPAVDPDEVVTTLEAILGMLWAEDLLESGP